MAGGAVMGLAPAAIDGQGCCFRDRDRLPWAERGKRCQGEREIKRRLGL